MIGMRYSNNSFLGKGVLEVARFATPISNEAKLKKEGSFNSNEPISVIDSRRSPSPSTSTSTLSSSLGGTRGGCGTGENDSELLGITDNKVAVPDETLGGNYGKEEWAAELQPFPAGLDLGHGGTEKFSLGLEDWESLLSESAGQDLSLLRWISGDVEDPAFSLKQLLQGGNSDGIQSNVGLAIINENSGLMALASGSPSASGGLAPSLPDSASDVSLNTSNSSPQDLSFLSSPGSFPSLPNLQHQQQLHLGIPVRQSLNPNGHVVLNEPHFQIAAKISPFDAFLGVAQHDQPQAKRHNPGIVDPTSGSPVAEVPLFGPSYELLLKSQSQLPIMPQAQLGLAHELNLLSAFHHPQKPLMLPKQEYAGGIGEQITRPNYQQQQPAVYNQLCKAAESMLAGQFSNAQMILARLNHQLSLSGKPFQRAAFYFKEALQLPLLMHGPASQLQPRSPTPFDGMFKMGAYNVLSEISPTIQFMNFTSNQAILEVLEGAECIHIIDFDIGFGAQWSSFMQELPRGNRKTPSLKITAFVSPSSHHPVEIGLMDENLAQFASDIGVKFELEVVNFDSFDLNSAAAHSLRSTVNEAIAVNFPVWSISRYLPVLPSLLQFIKQLSPKILISLERGYERFELPFGHHLLYALQYFEAVLESIDASDTSAETANKIERFLLQPSIESTVLGRLHCPVPLAPWRTLLASVGFSPVSLSSCCETQADCVIKRSQVRGFRVEKRQSSLILCWQHRDLLSISAWRS